MGRVRIGTASWTDPSLAQSGWYPPEARSAEERLRYYATRFPLVEVDSTYYFPPSEANSARWAARTPEGFLFNIKAFSLLTGHPAKPEALPPGVTRPSGSKRVYADDLSESDLDRVWETFLSALGPLQAAGKLGALLFQYPPWFGISRRNKLQIIEAARRADPLPIAVELRNESWFSEDNLTETLDFLEGHALPYVCVDMPQGFSSSVPPVVAATADLAMVRFHGRNADQWDKGDITTRYRYEYDTAELAEWVPRIEHLQRTAQETHVLMNNHGHHAPRNAADLGRLLAQAGVDPVEPSAGHAWRAEAVQPRLGEGDGSREPG